MQYDTINDVKSYLNRGYCIVDAETFVEEGYAIVEVGYLDTPYQIDIPKNKVFTLKLKDMEYIVDSENY